ncbi:hypothetical protein AUJ77_00410 [Candidatus Nomurabacteria bacterium CG1_02_43_90]|uniref:Type II toxin-antitoxin system mRNA interferase toxin, RelE/StbE family n=1 Tax=Candidatus Nomurabacteria bacterium CG1_02_43_90 TaxID=1805281 RepID=A0A1J4V5H2_9BACT|nr:MAG: hypothetical protein AUJ77_00410 [Candidatus Nomurabacteria bacterium CG1_02_43_90]
MFQKLPLAIQEKFSERMVIFIKIPYHGTLENHALSGEWKMCRSINITGDIRAVYKERDRRVVQFIAIGSHSELYS